MDKLRLTVCALLLAVSSLAAEKASPGKRAPAAKTDPYETFEKVSAAKGAARYVNKAMKAVIDLPDGFERVEPRKNPDIAYQFAFKHKTAPFEIRLHFMPLTETPERAKERRDCEARNKKEPGSCMMADLDQPSEVWGMTLLGNMSADEARFFPFPPEAVRREFGADWGYVSSPFYLSPDHPFGKGYKLGQLVMLSRTGAGKLFRIVLTDDVETLKRLDKPVFYCVRFEGARPPK